MSRDQVWVCELLWTGSMANSRAHGPLEKESLCVSIWFLPSQKAGPPELWVIRRNFKKLGFHVVTPSFYKLEIDSKDLTRQIIFLQPVWEARGREWDTEQVGDVGRGIENMGGLCRKCKTGSDSVLFMFFKSPLWQVILLYSASVTSFTRCG